MSKMHNPAHPGEVLRQWLPEGMSVTQAAAALHVNRVTLSNLLGGRASITANMALRLAAWLGTTPEVWLGLQAQWDLWRATRQRRPKIMPLERSLATA